MKTLDDIKNEVAIEHGHDDWDDFIRWKRDRIVIDKLWTEVCIRAQKEALRNAADNAILSADDGKGWYKAITDENN